MASTRKTGQHDLQLVRALADAAEAKKAVADLTKRLEKLEAEIALLRGHVSGSGAPPASTKRGGPPPLPPGVPPTRRSSSGKHQAYIDISEMAELVDSESIPPPRRK